MSLDSTRPPLKTQDINTFLQYFSPPYYLSDSQRSPWKQHPIAAGIANILPTLANQNHDTWQIILNPTTGPKEGDIHEYTTISIDDPSEEADTEYLKLGIQPHIRVETRKGKYQHHFLIESTEPTEANTRLYKDVCKVISAITKADGKAFANRWCRIPGTPRTENNITSYPTATYKDQPRYTLTELYSLLSIGSIDFAYKLPDHPIEDGQGRHLEIRRYIMHRCNHLNSPDECENDLKLFIQTYIGKPDDFFHGHKKTTLYTNYLPSFQSETKARLFGKKLKKIHADEEEEQTVSTVEVAHPDDFYYSAPEPLNSLIKIISHDLELDPAVAFISSQKLLELLSCELYTDKQTSNAAVNCHILLAPSGTGKGRALEVIVKTIMALSERDEGDARKLAAHKIEGSFRSDRGLSKRMQFCGNCFLYYSEEFDDVLSKCLGKTSQSYQYIKDYFKTIYDAPTKTVSLGVVGSDTELTVLDGARMPTIGCAQNGVFERYLTKELYRTGLWNRFSIISLPHLRGSGYKPVSFESVKNIVQVINEIGLGGIVKHWWDTPKEIPDSGMPATAPPVSRNPVSVDANGIIVPVAVGTLAGESITVPLASRQPRGRPRNTTVLIDNPSFKNPIDRELTSLSPEALECWQQIQASVQRQHDLCVEHGDTLGADLVARLPQQVLRHAMALVSPRYPLVRVEALTWYYHLLKGYSDAVYKYLSGNDEETTEKDNWGKVRLWIQKRLTSGKSFTFRDIKLHVRPISGTFHTHTKDDVSEYVASQGGSAVSAGKTTIYKLKQ